MKKIKVNSLPKGFEIRNGKIVEIKQQGGITTGNQSNYGLVTTGTTPSSEDMDGVSVKHSLTPVPRDEANIEAEGGETVLTDLNGDGRFGLYDIKGPRHNKGGVPLSLPKQSFIYTDYNRLKLKNEEMAEFGFETKKRLTPAKVSKKFDLNHYYGKINDDYADNIQVKSAELMLDKNKMTLSKLALMQEAKKDFKDGVPASSHPYLMSIGEDPIEFTARVEEISRQKAQQQIIESLPYEQQMQIAQLQAYMQQVDQQQQQQAMQEQGMQQQMPQDMQQMQQGMPPQGQEMMPPPPDMNPQQMAQMGYEVKPYDLPMAQKGGNKKGVGQLIKKIQENIRKELSKDNYPDSSKKELDDEYKSEVDFALEQITRATESGEYESLGKLFESMGYIDKARNVVQAFENVKDQPVESVTVPVEESATPPAQQPDTKINYSEALSKLWEGIKTKAGNTWEGAKPYLDKVADDFAKAQIQAQEQDEQLKEDPVATPPFAPQNMMDFIQGLNPGSPDMFTTPETPVDVEDDGIPTVMIDPAELEDPVKSTQSSNRQLAIATPAYTDPAYMGYSSIASPDGTYQPFFPGADEYEKNKNAYEQLEQTLTDVNDVEMQDVINEAYSRYLKNAKDQGLTNILEKDDLIKEYLKYQKNNYDVRNLANKKDRFNPNLDRGNKYAKKLFEDVAKNNPEYEIYNIDKDKLKNSQLFFQTLFEVDSEKDNPRFGVEQLGPDQKTNWAKNRKISKADGILGNNALNQFTYVVNPKKPEEPITEPIVEPKVEPVVKPEPKKKDPLVVPDYESPYVPPTADFWLQDQIKLDAIANRKRDMFLPWQQAVRRPEVDYVLEDPTRAIAAMNEQLNIANQAAGAFGGPQSLAARTAKAQGDAATNMANVIAGVNQRNVNTVNRGLNLQNQYNNMANREEDRRATKLYDDTQKVRQLYLNEKNFDREQYADQLANAYTNRANTFNMNTLYDNFNTDPTTGGMVYFTNPRAFDPAPVRDPNYLGERQKEFYDYWYRRTGKEPSTEMMNNYMKTQMQNPLSPQERRFQQEARNKPFYGYDNMSQQGGQYMQKGGEIKKPIIPFYIGSIGL